MKNKEKPKGVLRPKRKLSKGEAEALEAKWKKRYKGTTGAQHHE